MFEHVIHPDRPIRRIVTDVPITISPSRTPPGSVSATVSASNAAGPHTDLESSPASPTHPVHEGTIAPDESLGDLLLQIRDAMNDLEERRQNSLHELQVATIELAASIAGKVVGQKIENDEQQIVLLVSDALHHLTPEHNTTVRMNGDDLSLLKTQVGNTAPPWKDFCNLHFVVDTTLTRGTFRIDGEPFGLLMDVPAMLDTLRQHLMENLEHAQIERRKTEGPDRALQRFPDRRETA
ncbi:MAG: FliH/SctL family protein [Pirellulaceae bacterium]